MMLRKFTENRQWLAAKKDNLGDPVVEGRLIPKLILNKQGVERGVNSCGSGLLCGSK
jgi:hypothetical protein